MKDDYVEYYGTFRRHMTQLSRAMPDTMAGFGRLHSATMAKIGALDRKTKELLAVAIGVAVFMGGGPSTVYGAEALQALDHFERAATPA